MRREEALNNAARELATAATELEEAQRKYDAAYTRYRQVSYWRDEEEPKSPRKRKHAPKRE